MTATKKNICSIVFILLLTAAAPRLLSASSFHARTFTGDSTKTKYPVNDPRNPDCPCHKYQKLADEEYKKIMETQDQKINKEISASINSSAQKNGETKNYAGRKNKKLFAFKNFLKKHKKHRGRHGRQRKQIGVGNCVHW